MTLIWVKTARNAVCESSRNTQDRSVSAYDIAAATIRKEHHSLAVVLDVLQRLLEDIERREAAPDFELFAAVLYYIDDFPERCHHPKEDEYWFGTLRRRTSAFDAMLDALQADHLRSAWMMTALQRALVHYQAGAADGRARFTEAVNAYAVLLREHMRAEERLLERTAQCLAENDWRAIAAAFEANDDPLFGANGREEFRRLFFRIVNRLPRKLRLNVQRDTQDA